MSVKDSTAAQRTRRLREKRLALGWKEVRLWIPSNDCAIKLRKIAQAMRKTEEQKRKPIKLVGS